MAEFDLHVLLSSFLGVMVAETVVKPIAIRVGRLLIGKADTVLKWIPDWLSNPDK